jgi:hypothetical protein
MKPAFFLFASMMLMASLAEAQEAEIRLDDSGIIKVIRIESRDYAFADLCLRLSQHLEIAPGTTSIRLEPFLIPGKPEKNGTAWRVGASWQRQFLLPAEQLPPLLQKLRGEEFALVGSAYCFLRQERPYSPKELILYVAGRENAEKIVRALKK